MTATAEMPDNGNDTPASSLPSSSSSSISEKDTKAETEEQPFKPTTHFLLAFAALAILVLMVALDGTTLSVAIPVIALELDGTAIEAFWAGTSFLLASTVFQLNFASFSHIFGRMQVIMASMTMFLIGVLMAAEADNFTILLAGRAIQGIGGGGIITMTEILITDLVPLRYRGQWAGVLGAMWSIGSVSGPIIGGAFAQFEWRWIFWLNLPFIGVGYIMVPLFLRLNIIPSSIASKLRRVDWLGSVLFIASITSFLIPLTWGGVEYAWTSWRTLTPLIIGAVGVVAFGLYERYVAREPLLRLGVFANATANIAFITTTLHGVILWCLLYYQPLYYEAVKGYTPIIAGVALFPTTFTVAPMSAATGFLITRTNAYRWTVWLGWTLSTLGLGLTILLDVDTTIPQWVFINLVPGIGLGILFPALQFQLQAASSNRDMAFAVAMFTFFRAFGQAIGVALGGVIFQNQMLKRLIASADFHFSHERAAELSKDAAALVAMIKNTPSGVEKLALRTAYTESLRTVYIVLCMLCAVALLMSAFIKAYNLNVDLETEQGLLTPKQKSKEGNAEQGK